MSEARPPRRARPATPRSRGDQGGLASAASRCALREHVVHLPHLHRAAVALLLGGGPRHEGPREAGLTHLLEHMLFRGAGPHGSLRDLLAAFEAAGEEPDAYTTDDALGITLEVDPARLADAVALLAHVLARPRFLDLGRERAVVLEERLSITDDRGDPIEVDDLARALHFRGHPLARPVTGDEDAIRRHRRADLERLRRRIAVAGNAAVVVAGPLAPARVRRALAPLRRALPHGPRAADLAPLPPARGPRTAWVASPGSGQTELRLTFRAPGPEDALWPALGVLVDVLDGGASARLADAIVDVGLAYEAWASLTALRDAALLELHVVVAHRKLGTTTRRVLRLLDGLARGPSKVELERARARRAHLMRRDQDDPRAQAEWAARRLLHGLPHDLATEDRRYDQVLGRDVAAAARAVLRPENLTAVMLGSPPRVHRVAARRALAAWR